MPTYHTTSQSPATAQNQLDYAFASRGFHEGIKVRAMNSVEEWGASDHCRLLIEVTGPARHVRIESSRRRTAIKTGTSQGAAGQEVRK